jgi:2,3-dihydroxybiphenyl 1,2-dioxygenase
MTVQGFGYFGIGGADLDAWTDFAVRQLGLQLVDGGGVSRAFRMDDRRQRIMVDRDTSAERYFGWEVADAAALDALGGRLEAAGVAVKQEAGALADRRFVGGLISFRDPAGNRLEAFHGPLLADEPFKPGWNISGFRTGTQGLGHCVLMVPDFDVALAFYQGLLRFGISDYIRVPVKAAFLHVNSRHHSVALFEHPRRTGMHHLMMELYSLDDVGQGYDRALGVSDRVAVTLGRHHNDYMTSFYMRSPSDFLVEYGWGAREVDVANWQPQEMDTLASFWGHDGLMRSVAGDHTPPPDHLPPPPPEGRRAPLQVMEGNFAKLSGVCPWWDATVARG